MNTTPPELKSAEEWYQERKGDIESGRVPNRLPSREFYEAIQLNALEAAAESCRALKITQSNPFRACAANDCEQAILSLIPQRKEGEK